MVQKLRYLRQLYYTMFQLVEIQFQVYNITNYFVIQYTAVLLWMSRLYMLSLDLKCRNYEMQYTTIESKNCEEIADGGFPALRAMSLVNEITTFTVQRQEFVLFFKQYIISMNIFDKYAIIQAQLYNYYTNYGKNIIRNMCESKLFRCH